MSPDAASPKRSPVLRALTVLMALGFLVAATLAAAADPKNKKTSVDAGAPADAGPALEPLYMAPTKAPPPFIRSEPAPTQAPQ